MSRTLLGWDSATWDRAFAWYAKLDREPLPAPDIGRPYERELIVKETWMLMGGQIGGPQGVVKI